MNAKPLTNPVYPESIPTGWAFRAIEDLCTRVTSGGTPLRSRSDYYKHGTINWFKTKELKDGYLYDAEERITRKALTETSVKMFPPNTVLMAMYGDGKTITSLGILRESAASNQACCAMIADSEICDFRFLFYSLKYYRQDFLRLATGGAQRNLSAQLVRNFGVLLPPLPEQRAIAAILGALDDKIELNRRMNKTLEEMARALFQSWFVDFDPVRAKAEGRETGLPAEIAALFPDRLVGSEVGEIPEGWEVKTIGELATVVGGSTPSTKEPAYWLDGQHCWATPKDLSNLNTPVLLATERKVTDAGLRQISSGLLPPGTILLSSRAPIGYLAISEVPVAVNQGFIAMLPKPNVPNLFLLYWAEWAHEEIVSRANGSTFLEISKANFRPIPVVTPGNRVFDYFAQQVRPLHAHIVVNEQQSRTLAALRDALLPKLIAGELRVPEAAALVDAAA